MIIFFILPDQLFSNLSQIKKINPDKIFLIAHEWFFIKYNFHQFKLILHQKSLEYYAKFLKENIDIKSKYIPYQKNLNFINLIKKIHSKYAAKPKDNITFYSYFIPNFPIREELKFAVSNYKNCFLNIIENTPFFMNDYSYISDYFSKSNNKKVIQNSFYIDQRKKFNILIAKYGKPVGNEWNLDKYNRPKFNKLQSKPPKLPQINSKLPPNFIYPITHEQAHIFLKDFLKNRIKFFGYHQDHIVDNEPFLFHSVLSSSINIGLLTPHDCIDKTLKFYQKNNIKIENIEGYIRQIFWREYIWGIYERHHKYDIPQNFRAIHYSIKIPNKMEYKNKIYDENNKLFNNEWYSGFKINDNVPHLISNTIINANRFAYLHHIERLMVMANFFTLCKINPYDIFRWFSELVCIDGGSTDWVMLGNIFMGTFCDGGKILATKPYISSYNYIEKIRGKAERGKTESDNKLNKLNKSDVWNILYWCYVFDYKDEPIFARMPYIKNYINSTKMKKLIPEYLKIRKDFFNNIF